MNHADMGICFAIAAHTDAELCERLARALSRDGDAVIIHLDRKADGVRAELEQRLERLAAQLRRGAAAGQVHLLPAQESVPVQWSGFSQVEAGLRCCEAFLRLPPRFKWLSYHSGQDYPIKPVAQYRRLLQQAGGGLLLQSEPIGEYWWRCQTYNFFRESSRNRSLWFRLLDNAARRLQKPFIRRNRHIDFRRGSSWFAADRQAVASMLAAITPAWTSIWKHTACADEHYFQTLAARLGLPVIPDNFRHIEFPPGQSSPKTLLASDFDVLRDSPAYFARKVNTGQSAGLLDQLDQLLNDAHATVAPPQRQAQVARLRPGLPLHAKG